MAKHNNNAAVNPAKQAAQKREKRVQEEAGRQLLSFGPVFVSGTGYTPGHFIGRAFELAEAFVSTCERREQAIDDQFEPRPEPLAVPSDAGSQSEPGASAPSDPPPVTV